MKQTIKGLQEKIKPIREQLLAHPLYQKINSVDDVKIFMQHHVFAVWDFMSLLKSLQIHLTCTTLPWMPKGNASTRFLINEIVLGEESDLDSNGNRISHFELYLQAMKQAGASTHEIEKLIFNLSSVNNVSEALQDATKNTSIQDFVNYTFKVIDQNKAHIAAAVFTFGREDLIPDMFMNLINDLNNDLANGLDIFKYYLERHIEVDGEHHSHLAIAMTEELCANDSKKWQEAEEAVIEALEMRIKLWNGILEAINKK